MAHVVGLVDELPPGSRKIVRAGRVEIGVFNIGGRFYALPNVCTHQFGPLCAGALTGTVVAEESNGFRVAWEHDGEILVCPWHGLEFDVTTGRCLAYPKVHVRQYEVVIEDGTVYVLV